MSRRVEMIILGVLLGVLVVVYLFNRDSGSSTTGVLAANATFSPMNVREPELRLDLLDRIQKSSYSSGSHRNVFVFGPAPPPKMSAEEEKIREKARFSGPRQIPVPPVNVPAQFFGTASMPQSGRHVAFFQSGEDVIVVAEGDTFLNRFRVVRIDNDSADVMEIGSGRHATVPMVQPPANQVSGQPSNQPPDQPQSTDPPQ
jgi:hypothetical protein